MMPFYVIFVLFFLLSSDPFKIFSLSQLETESIQYNEIYVSNKVSPKNICIEIYSVCYNLQSRPQKRKRKGKVT